MNFELRLLNTDENRETVNKGNFAVYTHHQLDKIPQLANLPEEIIFGIKIVAQVLPFRINQYVCDQ